MNPYTKQQRFALAESIRSCIAAGHDAVQFPKEVALFLAEELTTDDGLSDEELPENVVRFPQGEESFK